MRVVNVDCPLCGNGGKMLSRVERDSALGTPVLMRIVSCVACGMRYTSPRIAAANAGYESRDSVSIACRDAYAAMKDPVFTAALKMLRRLCPPPARILDAGCGAGGFLRRALEAGYDASGVEPSAADVAYARRDGLNVLQGGFEATGIEPESFDIVTMWDVIEHVTDPRAFVRNARLALREGGVLAMRLPCADFHRVKALIASLVGRPSAPVHAATIHLNFFTPKTVSRLLAAEGFEVVGVRLTTAEMQSARRAANVLRGAWRLLAGWLAAVGGPLLDNIEVYARRAKADPK